MTGEWRHPKSIGNKAMHDTVVKIAEVSYHTGLSRATIYREIKVRNFPKQLQLPPQRVGWLHRTIDAWKSARRRGPMVETDRTQPKERHKALNGEDRFQLPKLLKDGGEGGIRTLRTRKGSLDLESAQRIRSFSSQPSAQQI